MPPLERHALLRPVSREHHEGLLFCWQVRQALAQALDPMAQMRIGSEFYHRHLLPHFGIEEEAVFPVLGAKDPLVERAIREHRRLTHLFLNTDDPIYALSRIGVELEAHIRFEERVLFQRVQEVASEAQLEWIDRLHGLMKDE
ncbi:MAG: hemerythrin domain-containing protein [Flavobacteriales bacterium]|nr:hemerythrin domain-containing protein [Flavobacteriales bacterium]MCB9201115.1 hemerythrin domain-containing protein [Flavobacteriales bacterium]